MVRAQNTFNWKLREKITRYYSMILSILHFLLHNSIMHQRYTNISMYTYFTDRIKMETPDIDACKIVSAHTSHFVYLSLFGHVIK